MGGDAICQLQTLQAWQPDLLLLLLGLVTLDEMKAKREDLVREHEKQLAAKLKSEELEGYLRNYFLLFHVIICHS